MKWLRQCIYIFWLPGAVFLFDQIAYVLFRTYDHIPWLDIPMHTLGGVVVAWSMFRLLRVCQKQKYMGMMSSPISVMFITALTVTIAVLWEFHEFIRDVVFGQRTQLGLPDTMLDLFLGLVGGLVSATLLVWKKR